jgi:hypothetical protein
VIVSNNFKNKPKKTQKSKKKKNNIFASMDLKNKNPIFLNALKIIFN